MENKHPPESLDALARRLEEADKAFADSCMAVTTAEREKGRALNRLNEAQKQFDERVAAMKKTPAPQSDWAREKETRHHVR